MPATFGVNGGPNNLKGMSPAQVAGIFLNDFLLKDKLDAQVMATALNVYATDVSLGGSAASSYGFTVGTYGLGDSTWNIGSDGAAFNVANSTTWTVMQILQDWDQQTNKTNSTLRKLALDVFGGPMPAAVFYTHTDFIKANPNTCQALANAIVHGLKWLQTAGPSDIIKTVPESYLLGDRALYLASFNKVREALDYATARRALD